MINTKDVVRMKIPYPGILDTLAVSPHMYICKTANPPAYEFVKCQTLKPYMITGSVFKHYIDEPADPSRNPFRYATRIDCDKVFSTGAVQYDDSLKTTARLDVCQALYDDMIREVDADGYIGIALNEDELVSINGKIAKL